MNGRLYDGRIGRFLQADPVIQELARYQGFNRYSYVLNNPLNATDPTGEFIPQLVMAAVVAYLAYENPKMRPIASIMVGVILAIPSGGGSLAFTLEGAAQVAFAGFASGATASGNLRGGFQGAGMGLAFFGAGYAASTLGTSLSATGLETAFNLGSEAAGSGWTAAGSAFSSSGGLGRAALHAAAGCASAAISGADCGRGALTAGLNKMLAGNLPGDAMPFGLVKYSVIGGTIASIGGGKFANGAMMGAFQYLFNELSATKMNRQGYTGSPADLPEDKNFRLIEAEAPKLVGQLGLQGQYTLGPIYYSVDIGMAFNEQRQSCVVFSECSGLGFHSALLSASGGISAQGQTGSLVPGRSDSSGIYWFGGSGLRGEGQLLGNQYGRGIVGLGTPAAGGGAMVCTQNNFFCSGGSR